MTATLERILYARVRIEVSAEQELIRSFEIEVHTSYDTIEKKL